MNIFQKIKLLFALRKPVGKVVDAIKDVKSGWKTISFWIALIGTLLSFVGALQGIIPAATAVLITTGLTAVYNILRGLVKNESDGVRPTFQSTEFWIGVLGIVANS